MPRALPEWTKSAGGEKTWAEGRRDLPTKKAWGDAIYDALERCDGRGKYSKFALRIGADRPSAHPMYPSVDHVVDPATAQVEIETRLVNDAKTIMSLAEFTRLIGHLADSLGASVDSAGDEIPCVRSFAKPEPPPEDEPPLPQLP